MTYNSALTSAAIKAFVTNFNTQNIYERDNYKAAIELTRSFIKNNTYKNIFIKVNFINGAFKTAIGDTQGVAKLIHTKVKDIDRKLKAGNIDLIYEIAHYRSKKKKVRKNYSFATKYCHCHRPDLYPIYDDYVYRSLFEFNKVHKFSTFTKKSLLDYEKFKQVLEEFASCIQGVELDNITIDRFLWALGRQAKQKKVAKKEKVNKEQVAEPIILIRDCQ